MKVIGSAEIDIGTISTDISREATTVSKSKAMTYLTTPLFVYRDALESIVEYQAMNRRLLILLGSFIVLI
jgi:hypothetical protein